MKRPRLSFAVPFLVMTNAVTLAVAYKQMIRIARLESDLVAVEEEYDERREEIERLAEKKILLKGVRKRPGVRIMTNMSDE